MSKLTPKDYIDAKDDLARAGFGCITTLLSDDEDGAKTPSDIATLYGIDVKVVELVKTTSSYTEYETISRLELERESLEQELEVVQKEEARVKPERWHYVVAGFILVAMLAGIIWGVAWLIKFIGAL